MDNEFTFLNANSLTFDVKETFSEGHPDEVDRLVWLETIEDGALLGALILPDEFWQLYEQAVYEAALRLGYEDPE